MYWTAASPRKKICNLQPILREEVEIAVASLKKGKSAGVDNIPAELVAEICQHSKQTLD